MRPWTITSGSTTLPVAAAAAASTMAPAMGATAAASVIEAVIGRAPDSSGRSWRSCSPLNQRTPRAKCHAPATDSTKGRSSASCAKNVELASGMRSPIETIR